MAWRRRSTPGGYRASSSMSASARLERLHRDSACAVVDAGGEAVLREAGLDESEIAKLKRS